MKKREIDILESRLLDTKTKTEVEAILLEVENLLIKNEDNTSLIHLKASVNIKLQNFAQAINDYKTILGLNEEDKKAKHQIDQLKTILKYNNIDIYASPNTNFDPWLD